MTKQTDPISVTDQIQHLSSQGMTLSNTERAERDLKHIGFHRLSSYWKPFELPPGTSTGTVFKKDTSFNAVVTRYLFDQRLRSLLLEAFSFIEISVRTQWAYQLAHGFQHGEFAHQEKALFNQDTTARTFRNSGGPVSSLANLAATTSNLSLSGPCCQQCHSGNSRYGIQAWPTGQPDKRYHKLTEWTSARLPLRSVTSPISEISAHITKDSGTAGSAKDSEYPRDWGIPRKQPMPSADQAKATSTTHLS